MPPVAEVPNNSVGGFESFEYLSQSSSVLGVFALPNREGNPRSAGEGSHIIIMKNY